MNDVYKLTISALITPNDIEAHPDTWSHWDILEYLMAAPEQVRSVEVTELVPKTEAQPVAKLKVLPAPEPAPEPVPGPPPATEPQPPVVHQLSKKTGYNSTRRHRVRTTADGSVLEYYYRSYDYCNGAYHLEIALPTSLEGKPCVWLTRAEAAKVNTYVMEQRAKREARKLAREAGGA